MECRHTRKIIRDLTINYFTTKITIYFQNTFLSTAHSFPRLDFRLPNICLLRITSVCSHGITNLYRNRSIYQAICQFPKYFLKPASIVKIHRNFVGRINVSGLLVHTSRKPTTCVGYWQSCQPFNNNICNIDENLTVCKL